MPRVLHTHLLVNMDYPYLVIGPGFDVATGVPRALKKPSAPLWWERQGDGTAFRLSPPRDGGGGYRVSLWWADRGEDLPDFPDQPFASGQNTVNLDGGVLLIRGSNGDWVPGLIAFDTPEVTYRWSIYTIRTLPGEAVEPALAIEMLTLSFDN